MLKWFAEFLRQISLSQGTRKHKKNVYIYSRLSCVIWNPSSAVRELCSLAFNLFNLALTRIIYSESNFPGLARHIQSVITYCHRKLLDKLSEEAKKMGNKNNFSMEISVGRKTIYSILSVLKTDLQKTLRCKPMKKQKKGKQKQFQHGNKCW